jgi:hypothetical protein
MGIKHVYETAARFGIQAAAGDFAYRAARKVTELTIFKGVALTMNSVDPSFLTEDVGCRWGFLDATALRRALLRGEPLQMDVAFVDGALRKGDVCYGAVEDDRIISYGWYSIQPTAVTVLEGDMVLHFDSAYAYMYRGYTLPEHRGRRLHGIGMARALEAIVQGGARGLVSIVDARNFASLSSCYRLGYHPFGQIFCATVGGHPVTYATKGCEAYRFEIRPARAQA